jgi:peptidoglycan/xylan/chitin deacetylase (PgdA/CDA1 family)
MTLMRAAGRARVLVTTSWDDGHVLDEKVAELLVRYGMSGTFYVAPENVELPPSERLSGPQLRTLASSFEIGGHTLTHRRLSTLSTDEALREISGGRDALWSLLGIAPSSFCYPGGDFTSKHVALVKQAGFSCARTVQRWHTNRPTDPFRLPTTVHAYQHLVDGPRCLRLHAFGPRGALTSFFNWDSLAIHLFERARAACGVWHLWGHSWEIERHRDWTRLERVLDRVAGDSASIHLTNAGVASGIVR